MRHDLNELYSSLLAGELGRLEELRMEFVRGFNRVLWIFFGICSAFLIIGSVTVPGVYFGAVVSLVAGGIVLLIKYNRFATPFKAQFKAKVIPDLVRFVDERLHYDPRRSLMNEYHDSKLYPRRYERHKAEDTITGAFDKTHFSFGEIHTEYKVKTKNGTSWHTIFQGLLFVADFNKAFHGETIIDRDNIERMFGGIGRAFQKMNVSRAGSLVRMENPVFEEKFAVYSTDEQECRYILTPSLMERIVELDDRAEGQICLSFRNSKLYVALTYRRDLFEPRIFSVPIDPGAANTLVEIVTMMTEIVEDLNLNTRIWTKE